MLSSALGAAFPDMAQDLPLLRPVADNSQAPDVKPGQAGEDVKMEGESR